MPTIHDIAREVGVSVSAVSHAFNRPDEISADLRDRILRVSRERGYRPDPRARGLRRGDSSLIALIVSNLANVYYSAIAQSIQQVIAAHGYYLVVLSSDSTRDGERRGLAAVRHERMAGAIVDLHRVKPSDVLQQSGNRPTVFITDCQESFVAPCVQVDNFAAAYAAMAHLAERGRRRIAHITGPLGASSGVRRRAAYRQALRDLGLGPPLEVVGDYLFPTGRKAMAELLERGESLDAVFAGNDLMALGALSLLRERGIGVPDDVAIIGFDNIEEATWSAPPLTTVDQPAAQIGAAAATLLLTALRQPLIQATVDVACTLVPRGTT